MKKVLIFEVPESFEPNVIGCDTECPLANWECNDGDYYCSYALFNECPF